MSSWRLWPLWFVLLLWDVRPTDTAVSVYKKPKGGEQSITCWSGKNLNVTSRIFCKNNCEEGHILVQTSGSRQTNGRFSIEHEIKGSPPKDFIRVTISNLTLSDSGRYQCVRESPEGRSYAKFMIEVTDGVDAESKHEKLLAAGEDFSHTFYFSNPGKKKTFCRNSCSEEDILVATTEDEGLNGRYKIQYKKNADDLSEVTVKIRNMSSADSGAYQVHLDQSSFHVWIKVSSGGNTQSLTMILVLIPVCVVVIVTVITLTVCMRRKRTDQGAGAGGAQSPESEHGNIGPEPVYQDLCLEDMEPTYSEPNKK